MIKEFLKRQIVGILLAAGTVAASNATSSQPLWKHYRGMCDASAMEMLDDDIFVAADDEDNALHLYSRSQPGFAVATLNLSAFSEAPAPQVTAGKKKKKKQPKQAPEIDFEGAARIDDFVYFISSHGANSKGKFQPGRHRLFAVQIVTNNGTMQLMPAGKIYSSL